MDLVTTAIIIREATKTAFAVKEIYSNSNPDKDGQLADLIASISENSKRTYASYDPTLDAEIAAANEQ
jgi:hypothetical protein